MSTFVGSKKSSSSIGNSPNKNPPSPNRPMPSPQRLGQLTQLKAEDYTQSRPSFALGLIETQNKGENTKITTPSIFDLAKTHQKITECISNSMANLSQITQTMKQQIDSTSIAQVGQSVQLNRQLLLPLISSFRQILLTKTHPKIDEDTLEQSIIIVCETINKLIESSPPNMLQKIVDEQLMESMILNTAHSKGTVRKISRSCIANYIRQYKDLKPILQSFREHGITQNTDQNSQQWIILILPNLLNLDQTVISKDCTEFVELMQVIYQISLTTGGRITPQGRLTPGENDVPKACSKVIADMLKRFNQFEAVYQTINPNYKTESARKSKEEVKRQPKPAQKMKSFEMVYGFLDVQILARLSSQNTSLPDRIKAFDEALTSLQLFKVHSALLIKYADLLQLLTATLNESPSSLPPQIITSCLKMINICLSQQSIQKSSFNVVKLTTAIVNRLIDQNKNVRAEAQQYFQCLYKMMGIKAYSNLIANFLDNLCTQQQMSQQAVSQNQITSLVDSVLNIIQSNAMKIKVKDDMDLILLFKALQNALQQDKNHCSKILEILVVLAQSVFGQADILAQAKDSLSQEVVSQLEEKLGVVQNRNSQQSNQLHLKRNSSIPGPQMTGLLQQDKVEDPRRKPQLHLPNINHQQHLSPMKHSAQAIKRSSQANRTTGTIESPVSQSIQIQNSNGGDNEEIQLFSTVQSTTLLEPSQRPKVISGFKNRISINQPVQVSRYSNISTEVQNQAPQSPFASTTMTSTSDRLNNARQTLSDPVQDHKRTPQMPPTDMLSSYATQNSESKATLYLARNKFNSMSHQVLPQINQIQKNASMLQKIEQSKAISGNQSSRNNQHSKSLAPITPINGQSSPQIGLEANTTTPISKEGEVNGFKKQQIIQGKINLDPTYFQQTNGSLTGSINDQYSTKMSNNKPGSGTTQKSLKFMRGTVTSMASEPNSGNATNEGGKGYLSINELEPLVNPELEWKMFLGDIKSDNWSRQFEACNVLRKVCKFHLKDIVLVGGKGSSSGGVSKQIQDSFHEINLQIIKLADSLRSSVSKQAMITLSEMFESLPKQLLEQDIDYIFQVLIKKSTDSNVFMAEEGERSLISMCRNLTEQKVLNSLMVQKSNKASVMRSQICRCIAVIHMRIKQSQQQSKKNSAKTSEIEKQIVAQLGQYMVDAAQEVRNQAKFAFQQIVNLYDEFSSRDELYSMLEQCLNDQTYKKVSDYIDSECV